LPGVTPLKHMERKNILQEFSIKTDMLIAHYGKYNVLNDEIIERIIFADKKEKKVLNGGTEVNILHGVGGKIIKAKTLNQKRLVESMDKK